LILYVSWGEIVHIGNKTILPSFGFILRKIVTGKLNETVVAVYPALCHYPVDGGKGEVVGRVSLACTVECQIILAMRLAKIYVFFTSFLMATGVLTHLAGKR
jgi:hypothetical protein